MFIPRSVKKDSDFHMQRNEDIARYKKNMNRLREKIESNEQQKNNTGISLIKLLDNYMNNYYHLSDRSKNMVGKYADAIDSIINILDASDEKTLDFDICIERLSPNPTTMDTTKGIILMSLAIILAIGFILLSIYLWSCLPYTEPYIYAGQLVDPMSSVVESILALGFIISGLFFLVGLDFYTDYNPERDKIVVAMKSYKSSINIEQYIIEDYAVVNKSVIR